MSDIAIYIPALKREVSAPGEYDADFPSSDDGELLGGLMDGFGQAQLDGFFGTSTLDVTTHLVTPDLSLAGGQLCVIYAAERILKAKLRQLATRKTYKAGPVEYTTESATGVLTALVKDLAARKAQLLEQVLRAGRATNGVHVTDAYLVRSQGYFPLGIWGDYSGFFAWELSGFGGPTFSDLI